jgi:hypothetical protein
LVGESFLHNSIFWGNRHNSGAFSSSNSSSQIEFYNLTTIFEEVECVLNPHKLQQKRFDARKNLNVKRSAKQFVTNGNIEEHNARQHGQ